MGNLFDPNGFYESESRSGGLVSLLKSWRSRFDDFTDFKHMARINLTPEVNLRPEEKAEVRLNKMVIPRASFLREAGFDPKEAIGIVRGLIDHETAHVRYTSPNLLKHTDGKRLSWLINAIEDIRVEYRMMADMPGSRDHFKALFDHYFAGGIEEIRNLGDPEDKAIATMLFALKKINQEGFDPKKRGWFKKEWEQACSAVDLDPATLGMNGYSRMVEKLFSDRSDSAYSRKLAMKMLKDVEDPPEPHAPKPQHTQQGGEPDPNLPSAPKGQAGDGEEKGETDSDGSDKGDEPEDGPEEHEDPNDHGSEDPDNKEAEPSKPNKPELGKGSIGNLKSVDFLNAAERLQEELEGSFTSECELRERLSPPPVPKLLKFIDFFTFGKFQQPPVLVKKDRKSFSATVRNAFVSQALNRSITIKPKRKFLGFAQAQPESTSTGEDTPIIKGFMELMWGLTPQNLESRLRAVQAALHETVVGDGSGLATARVRAGMVLKRIAELKRYQHKLIQPILEAESSEVKDRQLSGSIGRGLARAALDYMDVFKRTKLSQAPSTEILVMVDASGSTREFAHAMYAQAMAMWSVFGQLPKTSVRIVAWSDPGNPTYTEPAFRKGDACKVHTTIELTGDLLGMLALGTTSSPNLVILDRNALENFTPQSRDDLSGSHFEFTGGTNAPHAMAVAIREMEKSKASKKIMVFLTDGESAMNNRSLNPEISRGVNPFSYAAMLGLNMFTSESPEENERRYGPGVDPTAGECMKKMQQLREALGIECIGIFVAPVIAGQMRHIHEIEKQIQKEKEGRNLYGIADLEKELEFRTKELKEMKMNHEKHFRGALGVDRLIVTTPAFGDQVSSFITDKMLESLRGLKGS